MSGQEAGKSSKANSDGQNKSSRLPEAEAALKKMTLRDVMNQKTGESEMDKEHKFWATQPVPQYRDDSKAVEDGPIDATEDVSKVPSQPYALLPGFEWVTMDMNNEKEIDDVYQLLYNNYVEDTEAMFRFKYSASFLNWALKSPGWYKDWHIGIRATESKRLVAFISGVPIELRVRSKTVKASEINFLCVHKKLRSKRLAPVLIREVTRRCNAVGTWQAIYTVGSKLPTPVSTCRYYHRSLDWPKLYEVGFSPLPPNSTKSRQVMKYKLPEKTTLNGLRKMTKADIPAVGNLLKRYLDRMQLAQVFNDEEIEHWIINNDNSGPEQVVWAYVVELGGKITDFISFYCLESTVIGHPSHDTVRAAYLFYYATEAAFEGDGKNTDALKKRLNQLVYDALIVAKQYKFDVFNALSLLDNPLFLSDQKFGPGDGRLHYYLYNYRTSPIPGGVDDSSVLDVKKMGGVGVVML